MPCPELKKVSILGCGWLGLPLAEKLTQSGYKVYGSTTTPGKIPLLENYNIQPFLINCHPHVSGDNLENFFSCHVLFINIPFRRNLEKPETYFEQVESLIPWIEKMRIPSVIFTSSTSVYPEFIGPVTEDDKFIPVGSRAEVLLKTENIFRNHADFQTTVLRLSGLYGPDREIGKFLSGKKFVDGRKPVNLIHLDDCVNIIVQIIKREYSGGIFNLCGDAHPSRKELYTRAAARKGLPPPEFITGHEPEKNYKIVLNNKVKNRFGYQFKYPDPLAYISGQ